jgi:hypothetical protein
MFVFVFIFIYLVKGVSEFKINGFDKKLNNFLKFLVRVLENEVVVVSLVWIGIFVRDV